MYSSKDLERLWFLYKTEGELKGVSINSFCMSNNGPYTVFYVMSLIGKIWKILPVDSD